MLENILKNIIENMNKNDEDTENNIDMNKNITTIIDSQYKVEKIEGNKYFLRKFELIFDKLEKLNKKLLENKYKINTISYEGGKGLLITILPYE